MQYGFFESIISSTASTIDIASSPSSTKAQSTLENPFIVSASNSILKEPTGTSNTVLGKYEK
jgi:hypothetical protein